MYIACILYFKGQACARPSTPLLSFVPFHRGALARRTGILIILRQIVFPFIEGHLVLQ